MSRKVRAWLRTAGAVLALALIVANFVLVGFNRSAQIELGKRQQFINEGIRLGQVNEALVRAIAVAAVRNNDPKLGAILTEQGITVTTQGAPATPPAAASAEPTPQPTAHVRKEKRP